MIAYVVHMLTSGRNAEEVKAEVHDTKAQTAAAPENSLRPSHLSPPGENSPPKTRAAELMEMRKSSVCSFWMKTSFRHRCACCICVTLVSLSVRTQGGRSTGRGESKEGTASSTGFRSIRESNWI